MRRYHVYLSWDGKFHQIEYILEFQYAKQATKQTNPR